MITYLIHQSITLNAQRKISSCNNVQIPLHIKNEEKATVGKLQHGSTINIKIRMVKNGFGLVVGHSYEFVWVLKRNADCN